MDRRQCHPNRLVHFPVRIPAAEPPRANAEARLDIPIPMAVTAQAWWPPTPEHVLLCFEIVLIAWATGHTAPLRMQWKCLWCGA